MPFKRTPILVGFGAVDLPVPKPLFGGAGVTVDTDNPANVTTTGTGPDLVIVYRTQLDSRVRPAHAALEGQVWEINDPAAPAPPLGYGCRCSVEIIDRAESAKKPPTTEAASLKKFPGLVDNVEQYMGKEIAGLYDAGHIKPGDLLRKSGDPIQLTEARIIAAARQAGTTPKAGLQALAELNGMGLDDQAVRSFAGKAQALIDRGASAADAVGQVLRTETRIGLIASRSAAVREARIAKAIPKFKATGLLKYDPPPAPVLPPAPAPVLPPAPAPVLPPAPVLADHTAAIADLAALGSRQGLELAAVETAYRAAFARANELYRQGSEGHRLDLLLEARDASLISERARLAKDALAASHVAEARKLVEIPSALRTTAEISIPPSRASVRAHVDVFRSLVSDAVFPADRKAAVMALRGRRAFARPTRDEVHLPGGVPLGTTAHELGHLLEKRLDIRAAVNVFRARRTEGKPLRRLKDIPGGPNYGAAEVYRDGGFRDPYVGKEYADGYTEVVSMGLEYMATEPVAFAAEDPDHFRFIFNLVRGKLTP